MQSSAVPPENITEFRRMKLYYKKHRDYLETASCKINIDAPQSCSLKHLETRAKKKQLIEDRHQSIANDNRKLMEKMTAIMKEGRKVEQPVKIISKNERERRRFAERVNKENRMMAERLERMAPILSGKKLEGDFQRHQQLCKSIKHKRYSMAASSSTRGQTSELQQDPWGSTFDTDSYLSQRLAHSVSAPLQQTTGGGVSGTRTGSPSSRDTSPIRTMAEFRKQIITKKKVPNGPLPSVSHPSSSMSNPIKFEGLSGEVRFEMSHDPDR